MAKDKKKSNERTSADVAHVAGQLLNGVKTDEAVTWLQQIADDPATDAGDRGHAVTLLGVLDSVKRVAASALTQR